MNEFTSEKIKNKKRLGELLKESRMLNGFELENLSFRLGIKTSYLKLMEENRFDLLPSGIYGRNFIKKYSSFLNIEKEIIDEKLQELDYQKNEDPFSKKIVDKKHLLVFPKIIRNILIFLVIIICFLYLGFYIRKIALPPKLSINTPANNLITKDKYIKISGETEKEAELRINGELILNNNDGYFEQNIDLKDGLNNITISAKKKYSKENSIIRQILVE